MIFALKKIFPSRNHAQLQLRYLILQRSPMPCRALAAGKIAPGHWGASGRHQLDLQQVQQVEAKLPGWYRQGW